MQSGAESGGKATGEGIFDPIDILGSDFELALAVLGKFIWGGNGIPAEWIHTHPGAQHMAFGAVSHRSLVACWDSFTREQTWLSSSRNGKSWGGRLDSVNKAIVLHKKSSPLTTCLKEKTSYVDKHCAV